MRKVSIWLAPTVVAATVLVLAVGGVAQASHHVSPNVKGGVRSNGVTAIPSHKLIKSDFSGGFSGATLPAGTLTAVDSPQALNCPATKAPCTIVATMGVEFSNSGGDAVAACLIIDGSTFDNNGCAFAAGDPASGSYFTPTQIQIASVAAGAHTVQTEAYSAVGGSVAYWTAEYQVYG
jgi:hypothetical protein